MLRSASWVLRPIVLFVTAYAIVGILHEWAHALTAYALHVPSTLFHLYGNLEPGVATLNELAVIRTAGPLFCLVFGLICWFAYRRANGSRVALLLLYLAWFGVGTFFGNLMGTPFVGDFSSLATAWGLSMPVRYAAAIAGLVTLCGLSFFMGTELRTWAPAGTSSFRAMIGMIVVPAIFGTAIAMLIFLPMPPGWAPARAGEAAFWIFAAVGAFVTRKQPAEESRDLGLGWPDLAALLIVIVIVRLMSIGIPLTP